MSALVSAVAWSLVSVIHTAATYSDRLRMGRPAAFWAMLPQILLAYLPWAIFTALLYLTLTRAKSPLTSVRSLFRWLAITVVAFYIPQSLYQIAVELWRSGRPWSDFGTAVGEWQMVYWLVDASLFLATFAVVAGIVHAQHARITETRRQHLLKENFALRLEVSQQRLATIRAQLEPHFLFNTLNAIAGLIRGQDSSLALDAVHRLGALLRYAVGTAETEWVTLRDEWDFVTEYFALQQLRYGSRLQVELVPPSDALLEVRVPPLLLQPLIENAVRHDAERHGAMSRVTVAIRAEGDGVTCVIANSCPVDAAPNPGGGVGLRATRDRLALTYGDAATLTTTRDAAWFTTRLHLPRGDDE
jgi:hypothetical protein